VQINKFTAKELLTKFALVQLCTSKWDTHEIIAQWTLALVFAVLCNVRRLKKMKQLSTQYLDK